MYIFSFRVQWWWVKQETMLLIFCCTDDCTGWCTVAITTRTGEYVQTYFHFSNFPYEKRHCVHVHTCSEKLSFWFRNVIYFLFLIIPRLWSLVSSYVYLVLDLKIFDHRIDRKIFDLLYTTTILYTVDTVKNQRKEDIFKY